MKPIHEPDYTIVHVELFVMAIVHFCGPCEEVVTTVHRGCFRELESKESPIGDNVRPLVDYTGERNGQNIGKYVLRWCRILRRERHGSDKVVMFLVHARVDAGEVKDAMDIVEDDLADNDRACNAKHDLEKPWKCRTEAV